MLNFHFGMNIMNIWIQLLIDFSDMIYYIVSFPTSRERSHGTHLGKFRKSIDSKVPAAKRMLVLRSVFFKPSFVGSWIFYSPDKLRVIPWKSRKLVQMYSLLSKHDPLKRGTFLRSFLFRALGSMNVPTMEWCLENYCFVVGKETRGWCNTRTVVIQLVVWRTVVIQLGWNVFFLFKLYYNSLMQLHHSKYLSKILVLNECFNIEIFLCWKNGSQIPEWSWMYHFIHRFWTPPNKKCWVKIHPV